MCAIIRLTRHLTATCCACDLQNGTVAAASYAGSTLAYVARQMAGAIDIMVVKQPDGSLKSSPFYGK